MVSNYQDGSIIAWTKIPVKPIVEWENKTRQAYYAPTALCSIGPRSTHFTFNTPGLHLAVPLPVWLDEVPGTVDFGVMQNNSQAMLLTLSVPNPADIGVVLMRITDGDYKIAPGSRHHVTIIGNPRVIDRDLVADDKGALTIDVSETRCRILIMPVVTSDSVTVTSGNTPDPETPVTATIDPPPIPVTATVSYGDGRE